MSSKIDAALAIAFAPFVGWWGLEALLAVEATRPERRSDPPAALRLDVVIPAHDEETVIGATLDSLAAQRGPASIGTVLVVADHCSDATVAVAEDRGAEVIDRQHGEPGKPPSLLEGLARLRDRPDRGDAVVLLDADCICEPDVASSLAATVAAGADGAQAAYLFTDPLLGAVRSSLRRAMALRNVVRARGADRLGLPSLIFGSGFALRWDALDAMSFANPQLEGSGDTRPQGDDMIMAIELLAAGRTVRYSRHAVVTSPAPAEDSDLGAQRLRWETGQLWLWRSAARALPDLVRERQFRGLVAMTDWLAPPLAATVFAFGGVCVVALTAVVAGAASPVVLVLPVGAAAALATYLGVGVSQLEGPRAALDLALGAPRFLAWKASLYRNNRAARQISDRFRPQEAPPTRGTGGP